MAAESTPQANGAAHSRLVGRVTANRAESGMNITMFAAASTNA